MENNLVNVVYPDKSKLMHTVCIKEQFIDLTTALCLTIKDDGSCAVQFAGNATLSVEAIGAAPVIEFFKNKYKMQENRKANG